MDQKERASRFGGQCCQRWSCGYRGWSCRLFYFCPLAMSLAWSSPPGWWFAGGWPLTAHFPPENHFPAAGTFCANFARMELVALMDGRPQNSCFALPRHPHFSQTSFADGTKQWQPLRFWLMGELQAYLSPTRFKITIVMFRTGGQSRCSAWGGERGRQRGVRPSPFATRSPANIAGRKNRLGAEEAATVLQDKLASRTGYVVTLD